MAGKSAKLWSDTISQRDLVDMGSVLPHPFPLPLGEGASPPALGPERPHRSSDHPKTIAWNRGWRPFTLSQREREGVREDRVEPCGCRIPPNLIRTWYYHPRSMLRRCQRNSNMFPSCGWSQEIFMVETGPMFRRSISPKA